MTPIVEQIVDGLSWVLLAAGGLIYAIGCLGLVRMPDVFSRLHALSVAETLGVILLIAGMVLQAGFTLVTVKLLFILGTLLLTIPTATHALARAALHDGERPLLDDGKGNLVPTDPVALYPELEERLRTPISSETVDSNGRRAGEAAPSNS